MPGAQTARAQSDYSGIWNRAPLGGALRAPWTTRQHRSGLHTPADAAPNAVTSTVRYSGMTLRLPARPPGMGSARFVIGDARTRRRDLSDGDCQRRAIEAVGHETLGRSEWRGLYAIARRVGGRNLCRRHDRRGDAAARQVIMCGLARWTLVVIHRRADGRIAMIRAAMMRMSAGMLNGIAYIDTQGGKRLARNRADEERHKRRPEQLFKHCVHLITHAFDERQFQKFPKTLSS